MIKNYIFCFLLLALSGEAYAQLMCTNCRFLDPPMGDARDYQTSTDKPFLTILTTPGTTYSGRIELTAHSVFLATGALGNYTLNGAISEEVGKSCSLTFTAPSAAYDPSGLSTGITLTGASNTYTGGTIIKSGYIICNKSNGQVALKGNITISAEGVIPAHLWCQRNNQLRGVNDQPGGVISFDGPAWASSYLHLNGTTQTIAGIQSAIATAIVENYDNISSLPAGMNIINSTSATLNIAASTTPGATPSVFAGGHIRKGTTAAPSLTINITSGTQIIQDPNSNITDVTFETSVNEGVPAILELSASDDNPHSFGANVTFKGAGTIKKTGTGPITTNNSTILKSGKIWVAQGIFRNQNFNNVYSINNGSTTNTAILQIDASTSLNYNPTFDLWGNASIFGGLTGGGIVQNSWGSTDPGNGYSWLQVGGKNEADLTFDGIIRDSPGNAGVKNQGEDTGVALKKVGTGIQTLTGRNRYTGPTTVASGTLKLQGDGQLGRNVGGTYNGTYDGALEIANAAPGATPAVFQHDGTQIQVFAGNITNNTGTSTPIPSQTLLGTFLQSGIGKSIINGTNNSFSGHVSVTGGFLGGSGVLKKAIGVTVEANGSIGGGNGQETGGATLTVSNLIFAAATSKLIVTSMSDRTPSVIDVKLRTTTNTDTPGPITVPPNGFDVFIKGGLFLQNGYIIRCSNGLSSNLPFPNVAFNNTGKTVCLKWETEGLFMSLTDVALSFDPLANITAYSGQTQPSIGFAPTGTTGTTYPTGYKWTGSGDDVGLANYTTDWTNTFIPTFTVLSTTNRSLQRIITVTAINGNTGCIAVQTFTYTISHTKLTCDNCSFSTGPGNTGTTVTGTSASPAIILRDPGTFSNDITLKGPCHFTITGVGNYDLSGRIIGTGPLICKAPNAAATGHKAGITLSGNTPNTYSGGTTVTGGYIICNKSNDVRALPGNIKISAIADTIAAHIWCQGNNQFTGAIINFNDAQSRSCLHLNGTTQTVAGIQANNSYAALQNNERAQFPVGINTGGQLQLQLSTQEAILNIAPTPTTPVCIFGGGAHISRGTDTPSFPSPPSLTINITSGTQIIQNPTSNIKHVTFVTFAPTPTTPSILQLNTTDADTYTFGQGITFRGAGTIEKVGGGTIQMHNSTILTSGKILVTDGVLQNKGTTPYTITTGNTAETNTAILDINDPSGPYSSPTFDLWGNVSTFAGLTGRGFLRNNWGSTSAPGNGHSWLIVGQNNETPFVFGGRIMDNYNYIETKYNTSVSSSGLYTGGVALKKVGNGTQVLTGYNTYTGKTWISSGTLKLSNDGLLGAPSIITGTEEAVTGTYHGLLDISKVASGTPSVFEHNGNRTQVLGNIISSGPGTGNLLATLLQSGNGKTIIIGTPSFTGNITVTGGFLGGSCDLRQANSLTIEANGSIGGSNATLNGATLVVSALNFTASTSKLIVRATGANLPSLVEVRAMNTNQPGPITVSNNGFTVDIMAGPNAINNTGGYIIKCFNGFDNSRLPLPAVGVNNTEATPCFKWDAVGLLMKLTPRLTFDPVDARICANTGGSTPNIVELTISGNNNNNDTRPAASNSWKIIEGQEYGVVVDNILHDRKVKVRGRDINQAGGVVTLQFTSVNGCRAVTTIIVSPKILLNYMRASRLCESNDFNQDVSIEIEYSNPLGHGYAINEIEAGTWQFTNPAIINLNPPVPLSTATSNTKIEATFPGLAGTSEVIYVDSGTGCAADKRVTIAIEHLEAPVVTSPVSLCEGQVSPLAVVNPDPQGTYTWWSPGPVNASQSSEYIQSLEAPIPSTTAATTVYKVSKVKNYDRATENPQSITPLPYSCTGPQATISVTVNPKPTVDMPDLTLCANMTRAKITPDPVIGRPAADRYKWAQKVPDQTRVGLSDNTLEWLPDIPEITPPPTNIVLMRDMTITPYNSTTTCIGDSRDWKITVNPDPKVTRQLANREHCPGAQVPSTILGASPEAELGVSHGADRFKWEGGAQAGLADQKDYRESPLLDYRVPPPPKKTEPITLRVKITAINNNGCEVSTLFSIKVNPIPSIELERVEHLCTGSEPAKAAQTNIKVSPSPILGTIYKWSASLVDYTLGGKSKVTVVHQNAKLSFPITQEFTEEGDFTKKIIASTGSDAQVTFSLTPVLGTCVGQPVSAAVNVKGVDLLTGISNKASNICSGEETDIKVGDEGNGYTYTWGVTNSFNSVTGFTPPPTDSRATAIRDKLVTTSPDRVTYTITPKRTDCRGASLPLIVVVNPIPQLTFSPATASICSGKETDIKYSINLGQPEIKNMHYSWEVTPNALGARSSEGLKKEMPKQQLTNADGTEKGVTYTITPVYKIDDKKTCQGQEAPFTYLVSPRLQANIGDIPRAICIGDKVTLKIDIKGVNSQWQRNGKDIDGATEDSYEVPTDKESVAAYTVIITNSCGTNRSKPKTVRISADAYFIGGNAATDKKLALIEDAVSFTYNGPKADCLWDFNDNTTLTDLYTESLIHRYSKSGTYYPTLKATKPNQELCTKTFLLPALKILPIDPVGYDVYPIPTYDRITINNINDLESITLFDMNGKMIVSEAVKGRTATLSLASVASGVYLLIITDSKGVRHVKVYKI